MKTFLKQFICYIAVAAMLFAGTGALYSYAAGDDSITVTSAITGESNHYTDLHEALEAAERGSIVDVSHATLTESLIVDVEIMLIGYKNIEGLSDKVQILLCGNGAIFLYEHIRSKFIAPLYPECSEIAKTEENGGNIYYVSPKIPSLEGETLEITLSDDQIGEDLYAAVVDEDTKTLYLDGLTNGVTTDALDGYFSMDYVNAIGVKISFKNTVSVNGATCVANGSTLVVTADNPDYEGTVSRSYKIVLLGDVNGNGRIDAADASLILRYVNKGEELSATALLAADANCDGQITAKDAEVLCKKFVRGDYKSTLQQ